MFLKKYFPNIWANSPNIWERMFQKNLTKPIEPLSFLIDDAFQQPYNIFIQVKSEQHTKTFEGLLLSSDTIIGLKSPRFVGRDESIPVHLLVESLTGNSPLPKTAMLTVNSATEHKLMHVPLSSGEGKATITLENGGIVHLVAAVGKNRSETYVFVDGNRSHNKPTALSFPSATYIDGLSKDARIENSDLTSGLLYDHAVDAIAISSKKGQEIVTPIQMSDQIFSLPSPIAPISSFSSETRIHRPAFVRLGDHLVVEKMDWRSGQLHQQHSRTVANSFLPLRVGSESIPVLFSHSDAIALTSQQDKLHKSSKRIALSFPSASYPYYITTEPHFSETLILTLLQEIYRPHDLIQDAIFLHKVALIWDSIATRKAPWMKQILVRAKENVDVLISSQEKDGHWGNPAQDWLIVHALLIAGEQGLISSSQTLEQAASYICAQPLSPAILHVRYLYQHSIWNSFSCDSVDYPDVHPVWKSLWGEDSFVLEPEADLDPFQLGAVLQYYAQHKPYASVLKPFMDSAERSTDPWLQISWWILHKARQEKYANLRLYEYNDGAGVNAGLFHTWQMQNMFSVIDSSEAGSRDLLIKGSGNLYWGIWHFSPQLRAPEQHADCSIQRWLTNDLGEPISEHNIRQGQTVYIVHDVKGKPNQATTLLLFPAAGFSHQQSGSYQEVPLLLNEEGTFRQKERVIAQFQGDFQFPASIVHCEEAQARSQDERITISSH